MIRIIVIEEVISLVIGLPQTRDRWFQQEVVFHQVYSVFIITREMVRDSGKGVLRTSLSET